MLRTEIIEHQNVAPGSFRFRLDFDIYYPRTCGWSGYKEVSEEMADWCRERWGRSVGESYAFMQTNEGWANVLPPMEALWMLCGKALYVRTLEQAIEARLRWHGAVRG